MSGARTAGHLQTSVDALSKYTTKHDKAQLDALGALEARLDALAGNVSQLDKGLNERVHMMRLDQSLDADQANSGIQRLQDSVLVMLQAHASAVAFQIEALRRETERIEEQLDQVVRIVEDLRAGR